MRRLIALPVLVLATGAYAAPGPAISPPDKTEGVMERQLQMPALMTSARPVPRPDSAPRPAEPAEKNADTAGGFPLPSWAGQNEFVLPSATDPAFLRKVALGEPMERGAFALNTSAPIVYEKRATLFASAEDSPATAGPEDVMNSEILRILGGSYDMTVVDGEDGYEQLLNLAEGKFEDEPAAMISPDSYEFPAEDQVAEAPAPSGVQTSPTGLVMGMDPAAAILNSLSQQQVAAMTPDQISALVMAAHGRPMDIRQMPQAQSQYVPAQQPMPQAVMAGIPSLDYRGDALPQPQVISAADVPAGSMPFAEPMMLAAAPKPQEPIVVGNGENILLKGWKLGLTGSGGIGMYMNGDPGSIIEITEGMVVGPLGAVERITMEQGNIIARFTSGEVMTSPAALVNMASL